jgi:CheY-like chemotaxis protein
MATLLIDDQQQRQDTYQADVWAKTYQAGIEALASQHFDLLYLDHDLGDFSGSGGREMSGYDVLCWLEQNMQHLPGAIQIVSSNGGGVPRMRLVIGKLYGQL